MMSRDQCYGARMGWEDFDQEYGKVEAGRENIQYYRKDWFKLHKRGKAGATILWGIKS